MKAIKRSMAGEYSRELSIRVHRGIEHIVRKGFRGGALPGCGLRHLLVGPDGSTKQQFEHNQRKSISTDRVVFGLGPPEEVQCVRDIYQMYIEKRVSHRAIARALSARHIPAHEKGAGCTMLSAQS
jgi:DNA invertase Pin-like site-specific DNA recombinase